MLGFSPIAASPLAAPGEGFSKSAAVVISAAVTMVVTGTGPKQASVAISATTTMIVTGGYLWTDTGANPETWVDTPANDEIWTDVPTAAEEWSNA